MLALYTTLVDSHAQAQLGTTDIVKEYSVQTPKRTALNASITVADGSVWIAAEHAPFNNQGTTSVDLFRKSGGSWPSKQLGLDQLVNDGGMYPSVTTWQDATYVYVTGKQNLTPAGTKAHLVSYRQDRANFGVAPQVSDLGSVPTTIRHGRSHLTNDYDPIALNDPAMHLCWVSQDTTLSNPLTADDLQRKGKDPTELWPASGIDTISAAADVSEDHCVQDTDTTGWTGTAYHKKVSGKGRIFIDFADYDLATDGWTSGGADLQLGWGTSGHDSADFPVLSVESGLSAPFPWLTPYWTVVAQSLSTPTALVYWTCSGVKTDCDTAGDWTVRSFDPPNDAAQPMVVVALGSGVFVLWENVGTGDIGVGAMCDPAIGFQAKGIVARSPSHDAPVSYQFGSGIGSPVESVDWDVETETLHAAFVAKRDSQFGASDVLHWSVPGSTLCP